MKKKDPHGRLARWAYEMQAYNMTLIHRPGQENQNADGLSRQPLPVIGAILKTRNNAKRLDNSTT
jgi:hypothetical protein